MLWLARVSSLELVCRDLVAGDPHSARVLSHDDRWMWRGVSAKFGESLPVSAHGLKKISSPAGVTHDLRTNTGSCRWSCPSPLNSTLLSSPLSTIALRARPSQLGGTKCKHKLTRKFFYPFLDGDDHECWLACSFFDTPNTGTSRYRQAFKVLPGEGRFFETGQL